MMGEMVVRCNSGWGRDVDATLELASHLSDEKRGGWGERDGSTSVRHTTSLSQELEIQPKNKNKKTDG